MGHVLAIRARQRITQGGILAIEDPGVGSGTEPWEIRAFFQRFYQKLYREDISNDKETLQNYLAGVSGEKLSLEEREALETLITTEEIHCAISSLANGKAVGPDAIPGEF